MAQLRSRVLCWANHSDQGCGKKRKFLEESEGAIIRKAEVVYQADIIDSCLLHWTSRGRVQEGQGKEDL